MKKFFDAFIIRVKALVGILIIVAYTVLFFCFGWIIQILDLILAGKNFRQEFKEGFQVYKLFYKDMWKLVVFCLMALWTGRTGN